MPWRVEAGAWREVEYDGDSLAWSPRAHFFALSQLFQSYFMHQNRKVDHMQKPSLHEEHGRGCEQVVSDINLQFLSLCSSPISLAPGAWQTQSFSIRKSGFPMVYLPPLI